MYEFAPVTERIMRMRDRIRNRIVQIDEERVQITTDCYKENGNLPPVLLSPTVTKAICEKMTLRVEDEEIFVGNKAKNFCGTGVNASWSGVGWVMREIPKWELREDGLYHNAPGEMLHMTCHPDDLKIAQELAPFWKGRTIGAHAQAWKPDSWHELARLHISDYMDDERSLVGIALGHLTPGFPKIINTGYGAIKKQAQDWIDEHWNALMGEDVNKYVFYKGVIIACEGASALARRYGALCAEKAAACKDPDRKAELEMMSSSLEWLSENPARTFWEALQGTLLYMLFLSVDAAYPALAYGRFDQYTWPFLKKELEAGTITRAQAQEYVDAFFLKTNCFFNGGPGKISETTGIGNTWHHTTIGGVDPDTGEDATNMVTYMTLETIGRLKLHDPTISLRMNKNSPDELWNCALETSKLVGGLPLFQNDEVIIPGLMKELDFELRDARDYSIIGCQEIVGSGCDYPAPNGAHPPHAGIFWAGVMTMAINDGINPLNGEQAKVHTGYLYEMETMDDVRAAVEKLARYILKLHVSTANYSEFISSHDCPHPALSMSMLGCMESGKDVSWGGCKYNSYGGTATGLATVADSLTTIKYMCFDKKLCSKKELLDAVVANWEGYEDLRQQVLREVPHYGNNDPYADMELKWIVDLYYQICSECFSVRSKKYKAGLYGASDHIAQGHQTWATPDGRRYGEPIADAMSPAQSRDKNGPTSVFVSTCCFDHEKFMDGMALNLRMHPSSLANEKDIGKLRDMTRAYFNNGGMEVQHNVVDTATLREAQKKPEEYKDLVVRIAGYSAYFVELGRDMQNDIISRNENRI